MINRVRDFVLGNYHTVFGSFLLIFIFAISLNQNYLLFHTIVELLSIIVAFAVFIITWNSRKILDNNYLFLVGISYLFIGSLDLLHTITFKGMQVIKGDDFYANQFWVATRFLECITLLTGFAVLKWKKRLNPDALLLVYLGITTLIILSILYWKIFPVCFIEGQGQTPFKIYAEYTIIVVLLLTAGMLIRRRKHFTDAVFTVLLLSVIFTIISEFCFTLYISNYSLSNQIGHYAKLVSFYLVYRANVQTGFTDPTKVIFKNLKDSEEQYRTLAENLTEIIIRFDQNWRSVYANSPVNKFLPRSLVGTVGWSYSDLDIPVHLGDILKKAGESGELQHVDFSLLLDGEERFYSMQIVPEFSAETYKETYLMICFDISTLKYAEKELRELNATKDKFFSIIAHDLKNPFTSLMGFSQLLSKSAGQLGPEKIKQLAERMNESARQTYSLLENLLNWARIQTGNLTPVKQPLDPVELITDALRIYEPVAHAKGIEISAEEICNDKVVADKQMINAVLRNIVNNAIKFSFQGGKIELRTKRVEATLLFSISDSGVGMDDLLSSNLLKLENNLSQAGTANEKGTGLGLILCKEFIEVNDGQIWFESEFGHGTTFHFSLPLSSGSARSV